MVYMGADGEPCHACVSVDDMMKKGRELIAKLHKKESEKSATPEEPKPCPADKDELGRNTWTLLHTMSVYYPEKPSDDDKTTANNFMQSLSKLYPCDFCAKDLRENIAEEPPKLSSRQEFAQWMCELHNKVNEKTGKPSFDCSKVFERWRYGWKDGSCGY